MTSFRQVYEDERAQIVPSGVFSGGEFLQQQQSPHNPLPQYDFINSPAEYGFVPSPASSFGREELQDQILDDGKGYPIYVNQQPRSYQPDCKLFMPSNEPTTLLECLNSNTGFRQPSFQFTAETVAQENEMNYSASSMEMEQVKQLVMSMALDDVQLACAEIGISSDPSAWTGKDTEQWLMWIVQRYTLSMDITRFRGCAGASLLQLEESAFKQLAPACGEFLYEILDIWRAAASAVKPEYDMGGYGGPSSNQSAMQMQQMFPSQMGSCDMFTTSRMQTVGNFYSNSGLILSTGSPASCGNDSGFDSCDTISDVDGRSSRSSVVDFSTGTSRHTQLWQFLKELLSNPQLSPAIRWVDRSSGIFKIEDSVRVARLWGKRKNRPAMNYDKLSRSIRQYYKKGIMKKTERSQRLVYQFCAPYIH